MPDRAAFRYLWLATTVSQLGTQVSELAIPFIAIATLGATPLQVGLLYAAQFLPILVFSLPAGVWVDRLRRRPLLITADLARAATLVSIPAAFALGALSLAQLYIVSFLVGSLTELFDVAHHAYLPALVATDQLVSANSKLQVSEQSASVVGPAVGGSLITVLSAPFAVAMDAVSYLASAAFLLAIRQREPAAPGHTRPPGGMIGEILVGIRYVLGHPILRGLAVTAGLIQFFGRMVMAVLLVYLVRQIGLSAALIGTVLSVGSLGFVLGALLAGRVSRRFGLGRTLTGAAVIASLGPVSYALGPRPYAGVFVAAGFFLYGVAAVVWTVNSISLRQAITPPAILGRTGASIRLLALGAIPLGSAVGGLLGGGVGLRQTIVIGALGSLCASLPVMLSPVRRLRRMPAPLRPAAA
jgi:MFS family permease